MENFGRDYRFFFFKCIFIIINLFFRFTVLKTGPPSFIIHCTVRYLLQLPPSSLQILVLQLKPDRNVQNGVNSRVFPERCRQCSKGGKRESWTLEIHVIIVFSRVSFEYSGKYCIDSTGYVTIKKVKWPGPIELDSGNMVLDHYLAVVHRMNTLL